MSLLPHSLPEKEGGQGEKGWDDSELWLLKEKAEWKGASWQDSGVFQGTCGHSDCKFVSLIANFPPSFGGPSIHAG